MFHTNNRISMLKNFGMSFQFEAIGDIIIIYDYPKLNIFSILSLLKQYSPDLNFKKVVYRDVVARIYNGIKLNRRGEIVGYYPLHETVLDKALNQLSIMDKASAYKRSS